VSCKKCITYFIDRTDYPTRFTQNICSAFCSISLACGVLFHTYVYPASSGVGSAAAVENGANVCVYVCLSVSVSASVLKKCCLGALLVNYLFLKLSLVHLISFFFLSTNSLAVKFFRTSIISDYKYTIGTKQPGSNEEIIKKLITNPLSNQPS